MTVDGLLDAMERGSTGKRRLGCDHGPAMASYRGGRVRLRFIWL
jgi:hypothetical protein